jgi:dihydrofolate reductase
MPKIIIDMSLSLDGMIAGPNDTPAAPIGGRDAIRLHDWLLSGTELYPGSDFIKPSGGPNHQVVERMYHGVGALLTGRRTYDLVKGWNGSHPITGLPVVVLTHNPPSDVPVGRSSFTYCATLADAVAAAQRQAGTKDVMVHGASTTQQLLDTGLADELWLHLNPMLLGAGRPLFGPNSKAIELELTESIVTREAVHLRYRVIKA